MGYMPTPSVPVSWGELLDKLTILAIKSERIVNAGQRANIAHEHRLLSAIAAQALADGDVRTMTDRLKQVNEELWDIEDMIREQEADADFGGDFIHLARSVYRMNDRRAAIKRRINELLESELMEEKSYAAFVPAAAPSSVAAAL